MSASKPIIAFDNLLERGTVTASSEATGYEKENAFDGLTFDAWKANASGASYLTLYLDTVTEADCFCFAAHDLFTNGGTIKLQHSPDAVIWTDAFTAITPTHNGPVLQKFTPTTKQVWRIVVTSTPASYIGAVFIGKALDLERGVRSFQPPLLGREAVTLDNDSQSGQFLGRSIIRQGAKSVLSISNLTAAWVRTYWDPFMQYSQSKAFFMSWDNSDHPGEVAFCRATKPVKAAYNDNLLMDSTVEMDCIVAPVTPLTDLSTTLLSVPVVSSILPTGAGKLTLSWGAVTDAVSYSVFRAPTAGGTYALVSSGIVTTSYQNTGLANNTDYFYKVVAFNAAGAPSVSAEGTARTYLVFCSMTLADGTFDGADVPPDCPTLDAFDPLSSNVFSFGATWGVGTNQLYKVTAAEQIALIGTAATYYCDVEVKLPVNDPGAGVIIRYSDPLNFIYVKNNTTKYELFKRVAGVETSIASFTCTPANGDKLGIRNPYAATSLSILLNGAVVASTAGAEAFNFTWPIFGLIDVNGTARFDDVSILVLTS